MTENDNATQPTPGIIWGQDIQRTRAIQPPPDIVPYLRGLATGLNGFAAQRRRSIEYYIQVFELDRESFAETASATTGQNQTGKKPSKRLLNNQQQAAWR